MTEYPKEKDKDEHDILRDNVELEQTITIIAELKRLRELTEIIINE